jgi:hypothetical protein
LSFRNLMVSPGKLIPGHQQLESGLLRLPCAAAGHQRRALHQLPQAGRHRCADDQGRPVVKPLTSTPFHQKLQSQDCIACHSDHAGVKRLSPAGALQARFAANGHP